MSALPFIVKAIIVMGIWVLPVLLLGKLHDMLASRLSFHAPDPDLAKQKAEDLIANVGRRILIFSRALLGLWMFGAYWIVFFWALGLIFGWSIQLPTLTIAVLTAISVPLFFAFTCWIDHNLRALDTDETSQ
jgi:hypothetical protein